MKKVDFINSVSSKSGLSKKDTEAVVNAVLDAITEALSKGEDVSFIGFGSFTTSKRSARTAKVPGTDKVVNVPATTGVKFKAGKTLKDAVAKLT